MPSSSPSFSQRGWKERARSGRKGGERGAVGGGAVGCVFAREREMGRSQVMNGGGGVDGELNGAWQVACGRGVEGPGVGERGAAKL